MFNRKLVVLAVAVSSMASAVPAAHAARVNIRWEKLTVPFAAAEDPTATAQNSSAVVSLGKLGRVEAATHGG
jgi:hypothetical protein